MNISNIPLEAWSVIILVVMGTLKAFRFVHEGEQGIKLRFGKAVRDDKGKPKVIEPGFAFLIPFVDSLSRHHVRCQTIRLDNQRVMTHDQITVDVNAVVMFKVTCVYKALFEIENLNHSIEDLSMRILREVLSGRRFEELTDIKGISEKLLDVIKGNADEWGVEITQFGLTSCAPSPESANVIFSRIGARFRAEALAEVQDKIGELGIDSSLAAVLIGMPMMATANVRVGSPERDKQKKEPLVKRMFGDPGHDENQDQ